MGGTDLAAVITALGSMLGAVTAAVFASRGRREARRDQEAANRLREREQEQNYWKAQVEDQRTLLDRSRVEEDRRRAERDEAREDTRKVEERLHRHQTECDTAVGGLSDTIRLLQSVVHDEVTAAAAGRSVDAAERHTRSHTDDGEVV